MKRPAILFLLISLDYYSRNDEILGELQFSFICFLVGQNYDAFEQWKLLLKMFCTCDEALATQTHLYMTLISDLHFQVINFQNISFQLSEALKDPI